MEQNLISIIDAISVKLGIASDKLYSIFMYQATVSIIINIFELIAMILTIIITYKFLINKTKKMITSKHEYDKKEITWSEESCVFAWIIWSFLFIIVFFVSLYLVEDTITAIVNPEYWALKHIATLLKSK